MIETVWAILREENKFLLAQRGGTWGFPGRELKEVGLTKGRFRKLGSTIYHSPPNKYNILFFMCDQCMGTPQPSCNCITNVGWFSWTEMYSIDLAPLANYSLMYLAYLIQHYDHFPETWEEVDKNG